MTPFAKATTLALVMGAAVVAAGPSMAQSYHHPRPAPRPGYGYPGWHGPVRGRAYGPCCYGGPAFYGYYGAPYPAPYAYAYGYPYAYPPAPYPYPAPYAAYDDYPDEGPPPPPPQTAAPAPPPPPQPMAQRAAATKEFIVYFAFDGDQLPPDAQRVVGDAIQYAHSIPGARMTIVGYTDSSGTEGYNEDLSKRRSETVRQALTAGGVARDTIDMAWRGKHDQAVKTADGVREPDNRRVTIIVERPGSVVTANR